MVHAKATRVDPSLCLFLLIACHSRLAADIANCLFLEFVSSAFRSGLNPANRRKLQELKEYFSRNRLDIKALGLFSASLLSMVAVVFSAMIADMELVFLAFIASIPFVADGRAGLSVLISY